MIKKTAILPALALCLAISLSAADNDAQNPPGAQPSPAASEAKTPKKRDLGSWWEKNAMKLKPLPTQWLFHADGTFSYMNGSGNASGSTIDATADAELRKDRFTNHLLLVMTRKDMEYGLGQGSVSYDERTLREQIDFDPADYITFFAAIEDYRNTMMYMDKRLLVYAGAGGRIFHNEKTEFVLNGAMGYADFAFDRDALLRIDPGQIASLNTSPTSGGAIGLQTWRWKASPRFSFSEDASYMKYFQSNLGYRWTVNLNGTVPINKHFGFNAAYRLKKEDANIIRALGVFVEDRIFVLGIKASI